MMRCLEECGKQWRPVQSKLGWEKQKDEEAKEETEKRREEEEEETEKRKNSGSKESSGGMGDMGRRRGSGEVRSKGEEVGAREISQMDKGVWEEAVRKDAYKKIVGSRNRCEGGVYTMKREGVPFVERRKRGG